MNTKHLRIHAELKAVDETGMIEGYGSVFGNVDSYDDIVAPGAFARSIAEATASGRMPAMLWQHNADEPIGVWVEMREDDRGLFVRGQLADTQRGREARALIKMGALTGLSIGYVTRSYTVDKESGTRTLTDVELWEVSPVTFPANTEARITGAKAASVKTVRDFEGLLRDLGFSRGAAEAIALHGFKATQGTAADSEDATQGTAAAAEKSDDDIAAHILRTVEALTAR